MGTHRFRIEGKDFEVQVGTRMGGRVNVSVNGASYEVEIASAPGAAAAPPPTAAPVMAPAPSHSPAPVTTGGAGEVRAPISGVVLSVDVKPGDKVAPTTKVLVLEAMKMENEIFAAMHGTVSAVHAKPQQEVREGDLLFSIEPA